MMGVLSRKGNVGIDYRSGFVNMQEGEIGQWKIAALEEEIDGGDYQGGCKDK